MKKYYKARDFKAIYCKKEDIKTDEYDDVPKAVLDQINATDMHDGDCLMLATEPLPRICYYREPLDLPEDILTVYPAG